MRPQREFASTPVEACLPSPCKKAKIDSQGAAAATCSSDASTPDAPAVSIAQAVETPPCLRIEGSSSPELLQDLENVALPRPSASVSPKLYVICGNAQAEKIVPSTSAGQEAPCGVESEKSATAETASAVAALGMLQSTPFDPDEFMKNLASSKNLMCSSSLMAPVLVKSDGTRVKLDSSALHRRLGAICESMLHPADSPLESAISHLSSERSPMTPQTTEFSRGWEEEECGNSELSSADAQAIAALQALGGAPFEGLPGTQSGGQSVNSRHGAARGRPVTRSCPGCNGRISIACKLCSLCGYKFRGAAGEIPELTCTRPLASPATTLPTTPATTSTPSKPRMAGEQGDIKAEGVGGDAASFNEPDDERFRPTLTRVTATSLELHKKKEQERRAKEKHLLASLQTLLFSHREKAPTASEVTYNFVLDCAVLELKNRDRARQGLELLKATSEETEAGEGVEEVVVGRADTEKHKRKEQQRRAKKRQLLTSLQGLVLGNLPKSAGITGNIILELAVEQLHKERALKASEQHA